jgi:ankyrin repeat protein
LISLAAFAVWQFHRHHQALARRQEEIDAARQAAVQVNGGPSSAPIRRPSFLTNPLWIIPSTGDLDGLKQMLDKEPNRLNELVGGMRATMLHVAAYKGQPRIVEELLRRHAEVNLRTKQGHTPLYDCIDNQGTAEIAQMLLDSGADATIADQTGKTQLQLASERNKEDIAALLRQRGVKK